MIFNSYVTDYQRVSTVGRPASLMFSGWTRRRWYLAAAGEEWGVFLGQCLDQKSCLLGKIVDKATNKYKKLYQHIIVSHWVWIYYDYEYCLTILMWYYINGYHILSYYPLSITGQRVFFRPQRQEDPNADDDDLPPERIRKLLGIRMHGRITRVNLGRTGYYGSLDKGAPGRGRFMGFSHLWTETWWDIGYEWDVYHQLNMIFVWKWWIPPVITIK